MPIHLPAPSHNPQGPDGQGWNRLSPNAHMGSALPQCALLPTSYASLFESYDTRRARWGGFGRCVMGARACSDCPVMAAFDRAEERVRFNAARVLVRIEEEPAALLTHTEG